MADSLHDALRPREELDVLKAMLAESPGDGAALWRAARAQVDIAKQVKGEHEYTRSVRDSVYQVARDFAERAVAADSNEAEAHFTVALVLGQLSLTRSGNERVRFARTIYDEAARAVALDSAHDGAHHVLGAWHAEIKRLSGLTRFFAKTLFGAGFMDRAHWDSATTHLEKAVALNPTYIHHRLELAQVYADRSRWAEARAQLEAIPSLPDRDVVDGDHRTAAAALLQKIRNK
ncbi:MAG TPA: tetratricopeptide repeat protein [Anaeromyxobacteraceae bacterium]|nr:tetratricopeptide repeat protein [Anaeromyxobacteraceae bacterium]